MPVVCADDISGEVRVAHGRERTWVNGRTILFERLIDMVLHILGLMQDQDHVASLDD